MIPRLIIAAILVNASFWIAALAVDLSNLLGYNIAQLMNGIDIGDQGVDQFDESWNTILAGILAVGATILLLIAIIMAPSALLAFAMIILILTARKALIILMIVIAPIAFVAWLLPNTESLFKKWYQIFLALLLVFPITALVFGASSLASDVILSVAETSCDAAAREAGECDEADETQNMLYLIALGITAVPLFAVPALLFGALKAIGSIGAKIDAYGNRSMSGATGKAKQKAGGFVGGLKKDAGSRFRIAANNPDSRLQRSKIGRGMARASQWRNRRDKLRDARSQAADRADTLKYAEQLSAKDDDGNYKPEAVRLQKAAAGGAGVANTAAQTRALARATEVAHKQFDDDVDAYKTTLTSMSNEKLLSELQSGNGSAEYQAAVAGTLMQRNHRESHLAALRIMGQRARDAEAAADGDEKKVITDVQKQMAHDMRDKPWALGDQAAGMLQEGTYGYKQSNTGETYDRQLGDIDQEMKERVMSKLSTQSLVNMNPDELKAIHKMAIGTHPSGIKLDDAELANLNEKIEAIKSSRYRDDVKPEAQGLFEDIKVEYQKVASSSATPASTTPSPQLVTSPVARTNIERQEAIQVSNPTTAASAPEFTREQLKAMGPENAQQAVQARGGMENIHTDNVINIVHEHPTTDVGRQARDELTNRNVMPPKPTPKNLP